MRVTRRKRSKTEPKTNENWQITEEFQLSPRVTLKPLVNFKVKGQRGQTFTFKRLVTNTKTNKTWVDCVDTETGEMYSFYTDRITRRVK